MSERILTVVFAKSALSLTIYRDSTHQEVRNYLHNDRATFTKRQAMGYLWGKNWKKIT
jgi:hypothetical protein